MFSGLGIKDFRCAGGIIRWKDSLFGVCEHTLQLIPSVIFTGGFFFLCRSDFWQPYSPKELYDFIFICRNLLL